MTTTLLIAIALSAALVLLLRDWRKTISALLANSVAVALFLAHQGFLVSDISAPALHVSTIVVVKLITGLAVSLILAITALTFSREYGLEDLDEFGMAELRRAARAAQRQQESSTVRLSEYVLPFWAMVLALIASLTLPRLYPITPAQSVDFAWYWLILAGLFTLATANDLLKIGLGLLLCSSSIDMLYTAVLRGSNTSGVNVVPLALLSLGTILLALMVAYLSGLLFGRLKTLELNELYKR